ncbi:MFS transporter [Sphingomonas sp. DT-204]|uniref:MFS transporter n=1 Tax=Sphingomonas sp. DT-204 TaxID=3396166 RepID=UPI003F1D2498
MRADSPERLSLARLAIFSLPMVIVATIETAWRVYLPSFFATGLGLSLGTAGALLMAARLFDSVIDPAIAWASDRFPTRHGNRRPWLVASVPLVMLGALGVFFVWPWTSLGFLAAACLLLHLGYMMLVTPHGGWALEIARDPAERLRVMGAKTWFAVAGMIAVVLLPAALERGFGVGRQGQVAALGVILLLLCPLAVFLVVRHVGEPRLPRTRAAELANPLRLFAGIARDPALRPILLLYLFAGLAESASAATFLFFIEGALKLERWGSTLLLVQSSMMLAALPLWSRLGGCVSSRRLLMFAYAGQIAVAPFALLLPAGTVAAVIPYLLLRGLFAGVDFMLLRAMVAEVARATAATGLRNGASCYSVSNITLKLAMGGGAWLALSVVAAASEPLATGGDPDMQGLAIRIAYALPSMIASAAGLLILGARNRTVRCRTRLICAFAPAQRPALGESSSGRSSRREAGRPAGRHRRAGPP